MRKRIGKRLLAGIVSVTLLMGMESTEKAKAAETVQKTTEYENELWQTCDVYDWSNVECQDYYVYGNTIGSYLTTCSDGRLMRVQTGQESNRSKTIVEYYNSDYELLETKNLDVELPIFGGFYETENNYFLLTGLSNSTETDTAGVFRITKYDKEWNRIKSTAVYGGDTTIPFDAGSARMDSSGKYLIIRTCRERYKTADDINHQSNVTIQVDMDNMKVTDYSTTDNGNISHSFNQFIKLEDDKIVAVDHSDGGPRAFVLLQYDTDISTGSFQTNNCKKTKIMEFPSSIVQFPDGSMAENNYTGASAGGFEISDSSYLLAGNAIDMTDVDHFLTNTTRNIFVAAVDKTSNEVTTNWLTDYEEGDGTTSTPHMVKISDNQYMVLWSRDGMVYYTTIDGKGKKISETYQMEGNLSDCVPTIVNNKLVWYTWDYETIVFYDIDLNDLNKTNKKLIKNGHEYGLTSQSGILADLTCKHCGFEKSIVLPTEMYPYWSNSETGGSSTAAPVCEYLIGEKLFLRIPKSNGVYPEEANTDIDVIISNPEVVSYTPKRTTDGSSEGYFTMEQAGTAEITIRSKWRPEVAKTYTFIVDDHLHEYEWINTVNGVATFGCSVEGCDFTKTIEVASAFNLGYRENSSGWNTSIPDDGVLTIDANQTFYYSVSPTDYQEVLAGKNKEADIIVADPTIVTFTPTGSSNGTFTALKTGKTTVTFRLKYNPSVEKTFTIRVKGDLAIHSFTTEKVSPQEVGTAIPLKAEAFGGDWEYTYKFYETDASGNTTVIQDFSSSAECTWTPDEAGAKTLYVQVKDSEGKVDTKYQEYVVSPALLKAEDFTFSQPVNRTYDGCAKTATIEAKNSITGIGAVTIKYYNEEGTLLADEPVNPGTYTVKIDVAEGKKYAAATDLADASWKFTIGKATDVPNAPLSAISASHKLNVVRDIELPENWQWTEASREKPLNADETIKAAAEYIGNDKGNYTNTTVSIEITVDGHTGGTATCITKAVCTVCGNEYGETDTANHVGKTEVRDASEADCLHAGYTGDIYCCLCGLKIVSGEVKAALGHDFAKYNSNGDATCSTDGTKTAKCTRCEAEDTIIDLGTKLSHRGGTATCKEKAICEVCGESYGDLDPTNHINETEVRNKIPATCTSEGYSGDIYCKGCQVILSEGNELEKIEHHWNEDYTVDQEADCTNPGRKSIYCKDCQTVKESISIPPLGHSFTNYVSNGDATCIADGTKTAYCQRCRIMDTVIDFGSKTGIHQGGTATCSEPAKCSVCGECYGTPDSSKHAYEITYVKEATCTEQGYTTFTCSLCENTYDAIFIDAIGHDFVCTETVQETTCEQDGIYLYTCNYCGEKKTEKVPAKIHEYSEEWVETRATCSQEGVMACVCKKCGKKKLTPIPKLEHQYRCVVLEEPTTSKLGLRKYVCNLCRECYYEIFRLDGSVVAIVDEPVISVPDDSENTNGTESSDDTGKTDSVGNADGNGKTDEVEGTQKTGNTTPSLEDMVSFVENIITVSDVTKVTKAKKQSFQLKVSQKEKAKLSFSSSNKAVKVDESGRVTIAKNFTGKVIITIKAAAAENYKAVMKKITIQVNPAPVKIFKGVSKKQKLVINWKKNTKAAGYQIQYAADKNFKKPLKTVKIKNNKTVSYKSSKLIKGKIYYVRVRTYKNGCYSSWSKSKKVKMG